MLLIFIITWFYSWLWRILQIVFKKGSIWCCVLLVEGGSSHPKDLFHFLKLNNISMKHWFDNLGWDIKENMHDLILHYMKQMIRESLFLASFEMKSWLLIMNLGFSFMVMLLKLAIYNYFIELEKGHQRCYN